MSRANGPTIAAVQAQVLEVNQLRMSPPLTDSAELPRLFDVENAVAWKVAQRMDPHFAVAEQTFLAAAGGVYALSLLREPMAAFAYPVDAREPAGLDELHRRMVASLDWYVDTFARRDSLMDVKTTRIRNLLSGSPARDQLVTMICR